MHGKPRHRCERHKLDKKSVLESKSIHENRRWVVTGNSHQKRVRRGCVLPPCLFNLYTENIFGAMNTNTGIKIGGTTINNLRWTDYTVLLAETEEDLQEISNEVNRIGKTFAMKMNAKKTKTMLVSKDVTLTKVSLKIDGDIIKQTDNYTYLGQTKWKM